MNKYLLDRFRFYKKYWRGEISLPDFVKFVRLNRE
jgi:hypothetical protein